MVNEQWITIQSCCYSGLDSSLILESIEVSLSKFLEFLQIFFFVLSTLYKIKFAYKFYKTSTI